MNAADLRNVLTKTDAKRDKALEDIATLCRMVLPVLKDHNLTHLAEDLGAKLFELDLVQQEMTEVIKGNVDALVELMMSKRS